MIKNCLIDWKSTIVNGIVLVVNYVFVLSIILITERLTNLHFFESLLVFGVSVGLFFIVNYWRR